MRDFQTYKPDDISRTDRNFASPMIFQETRLYLFLSLFTDKPHLEKSVQCQNVEIKNHRAAGQQ